MKLIEYRIMMPLSVEENQIGQLWSFAEVSRLNTGGGEGVEILENTMFDIPFEDDATGRISLEDLPEYEDYETQKGQSHSPPKSNTLNPNSDAERKMKKSASKENFGSRRGSTLSERSKSLDHSTQNGHHHNHNNNNNTTNSNHNHHHNHHHHTGEVTKKSLEHPVHGQFTHKFYILDSKIPWFVRKLIPKDSTKLHERSWNMYPTVKTVLTNEYFRTNFRIEIDTITRACPTGEPEYNVHGLTPEQLEKREIVNIDIAEPIADSDYKRDEDPALFKSVKTGRGPLNRKDWPKALAATPGTPMICLYKLVFVEFKMFGLQTRCEGYLRNMYKQLFTIFHRQVFCWLDKWHGLSMEQVRRIEQELARDLVSKRTQGELSKAQLVNNE